MEEMKFRHELKYEISNEDYYVLRQRLRAVMKSDCHAGSGGTYKIRSLYFETPDDKALREKLNGICEREKFRIRYYNEDYSFIRLEKKYKKNNVGNKLSAALTKEECEKIIAGNIVWMKNSQSALVMELYGKMKGQQLRPKVIVDYLREPYTYTAGNVRITLDSNIRTAVHALDFFNPQLPTVKVLGANPVVMEVKYDAFLPAVVRDIIQIGSRRAGAFSKYGYSRMFG